jgi:hypothetical protein
MTEQHKATPEQWGFIELYADSIDPAACILELRARIEVLEAAQQPRLSTAGPLVDRVQRKIDDHGCGQEARPVILEVAAWLREKGYNTLQAEALAQEANR